MDWRFGLTAATSCHTDLLCLSMYVVLNSVSMRAVHFSRGMDIRFLWKTTEHWKVEKVSHQLWARLPLNVDSHGYPLTFCLAPSEGQAIKYLICKKCFLEFDMHGSQRMISYVSCDLLTCPWASSEQHVGSNPNPTTKNHPQGICQLCRQRMS